MLVTQLIVLAGATIFAAYQLATVVHERQRVCR